MTGLVDPRLTRTSWGAYYRLHRIERRGPHAYRVHVSGCEFRTLHDACRSVDERIRLDAESRTFCFGDRIGVSLLLRSAPLR